MQEENAHAGNFSLSRTRSPSPTPPHIPQASLLPVHPQPACSGGTGAFGEPILPAPPGGEREEEHNATCFQCLHSQHDQIYSPQTFLDSTSNARAAPFPHPSDCSLRVANEMLKTDTWNTSNTCAFHHSLSVSFGTDHGGLFSLTSDVTHWEGPPSLFSHLLHALCNILEEKGNANSSTVLGGVLPKEYQIGSSCAGRHCLRLQYISFIFK